MSMCDYVIVHQSIHKRMWLLSLLSSLFGEMDFNIPHCANPACQLANCHVYSVQTTHAFCHWCLHMLQEFINAVTVITLGQILLYMYDNIQPLYTSHRQNVSECPI